MRNMTRSGHRNIRPLLWLSLLLILLIAGIPKEMWAKSAITSNISKETIQRVIDKLIQTHVNNHQFRIQRGVTQTASFWRESDGSETDFEDFCKKHFISDPVQLSQTLKRVETNFETRSPITIDLHHVFRQMIDCNRWIRQHPSPQYLHRSQRQVFRGSVLLQDRHRVF